MVCTVRLLAVVQWQVTAVAAPPTPLCLQVGRRSIDKQAQGKTGTCLFGAMLSVGPVEGGG